MKSCGSTADIGGVDSEVINTYFCREKYSLMGRKQPVRTRALTGWFRLNIGLALEVKEH